MATNTIPDGVKAMMKVVDDKILLATKRVLSAARGFIIMQPEFPIVTSNLIKSIQGMPMHIGDSTYGNTIQNHTTDGYFGSAVKYARRIEFGFIGTDSLGRKYNQQPTGIMARGFALGFKDYKNIIINTLKENANNNQASSGSITG